MKRHCIYKVNEDSKNLFTEALVSEYVIVEEFAQNPLKKTDEMSCVYKHIFIDDLEYTSHILGYSILPCKEFEKHFTLFMETTEINEKLRELEFKK